MKKVYLIGLVFVVSNVMFTAQSQEAKEVETTPAVAKSLELYVFPTKDQDKKQQEADEMACYNWAVEQTGYNPIKPTTVEAKEVDRSADGTAVKTAARGAAAGAAIGAIAGDAGKGAAIGAAAGGMRGRRSKVVGDEKQQQQNNQEASAANQKMLDDFKKAFSACMEGKGYTVK